VAYDIVDERDGRTCRKEQFDYFVENSLDGKSCKKSCVCYRHNRLPSTFFFFAIFSLNSQYVSQRPSGYSLREKHLCSGKFLVPDPVVWIEEKCSGLLMVLPYFVLCSGLS
jgi:hypothetical protein